ncbi:MAG: hypothetical protein U0L38_04680 [Bacteroidales bacterium]|nr:hypothetical protein [Bacteroidales bacterium]
MKKILMLIACASFGIALNAQTPPIPPELGSTDANQKTGENSVKGTAPIAPATLLLLGLGASAAGITVFRNQKQKED